MVTSGHESRVEVWVWVSKNIIKAYIMVVTRLIDGEDSTQRSSQREEKSRSGTRIAALSNSHEIYRHKTAKVNPLWVEIKYTIDHVAVGAQMFVEWMNSSARKEQEEWSWELGSGESWASTGRQLHPIHCQLNLFLNLLSTWLMKIWSFPSVRVSSTGAAGVMEDWG